MKPGAVEIQSGGNLSPDDKGERQPETYRHGNVEKGLSEADQVFEDHYSSGSSQQCAARIRVSLAQWEGDKLTVYASTQGISNCRIELLAI